MATTITIDGNSYLKREPLGVLGLSFTTLGIYFSLDIQEHMNRIWDGVTGPALPPMPTPPAP